MSLHESLLARADVCDAMGEAEASRLYREAAARGKQLRESEASASEAVLEAAAIAALVREADGLFMSHRQHPHLMGMTALE
jgi:hypothetical protein